MYSPPGISFEDFTRKQKESNTKVQRHTPREDCTYVHLPSATVFRNRLDAITVSPGSSVRRHLAFIDSDFSDSSPERKPINFGKKSDDSGFLSSSTTQAKKKLSKKQPAKDIVRGKNPAFYLFRQIEPSDPSSSEDDLQPLPEAPSKPIKRNLKKTKALAAHKEKLTEKKVAVKRRRSLSARSSKKRKSASVVSDSENVSKRTRSARKSCDGLESRKDEEHYKLSISTEDPLSGRPWSSEQPTLPEATRVDLRAKLFKSANKEFPISINSTRKPMFKTSRIVLIISALLLCAPTSANDVCDECLKASEIKHNASELFIGSVELGAKIVCMHNISSYKICQKEVTSERQHLSTIASTLFQKYNDINMYCSKITQECPDKYNNLTVVPKNLYSCETCQRIITFSTEISILSFNSFGFYIGFLVCGYNESCSTNVTSLTAFASSIADDVDKAQMCSFTTC